MPTKFLIKILNVIVLQVNNFQLNVELYFCNCSELDFKIKKFLCNHPSQKNAAEISVSLKSISTTNLGMKVLLLVLTSDSTEK